MAASIKSSKSSSSASGSNIQWKFSGNKRATDDESSSSPSKRQKSSSASASASASNIRWKYDVFLSFRGEDTRNSFTGHLYTALKQKGIYTFRDDERLERGKEISSELLEAIEESRFSIVILSENYASSTWCLDELSKIVECMDSQNHTVFPVFYKVDPSDVRKQTGDFKTAFDKHEQVFKDNPEMVKRWRSALKQVGKLAGWDLKEGSEANLIEDIVSNISRRLINLLPSVIEEQLVGIESRVEEIYKLLELELVDRVTFVGICGMGGIGKTTIARVVYERLSNKYEGSCFLANVREISEKRGVDHLQQMLLEKILDEKNLNICNGYDGISLIRRRLCEKKVFLVLDDVDQLEQLEQLAGINDWFGSGSRIIVTTRDEHVLVSHGIENLYRVQGFDYYEARSLFRLKAFKNRQQTTDHVELLEDAVRYANGLPLALKVLGSFLCDRSFNEWKSAVKRLQEVPNEKIMKILQISYESLGKLDKKIFLDIACFFKGKYKDRVMEILNSCNFHPDIGLEVLREKSLISIGMDSKIWMHDLIQEMGWEIVREEHPDDPCKWSRIWLFEDIYQVLGKNMETPSVEAINLDGDKHREEITHLKLNGKSFLGMSNLRLLIINDVDVHISEDLEYLSNELRFLEWHGYPLKSLPSSFQLQRLVQLSLCYSRIEYIWKEIKPSMKYLKTINLSFSHNFIKTPDFEMIPNLERLDLRCCTKLREVHKSVGSLGKLIVLNLNGCSNLVVFLSDVRGLKSLKILNLNGCSKLDTLPLNLEEVEPLEELDISGSAIKQNVISSIVQLKNLKTLSFRGCKVGPPKTWSFSLFRSWLTLPTRKSGCMGLMLPPLTGLYSLRKLDVRDCNLLEISSDIGSLFSLEELYLDGNNFVSLPDSISQLSRLRYLSLEKCQRLQWLPTRKSSCMGLMLPLAGLSSLTGLNLSHCNLLEMPSDISSLFSLRELNLCGNNFVSLPDSIGQLSRLTALSLEKCQRLQSLPKLPPKIRLVRANDCTSLKTISSVLELTSNYLFLEFFNCFQLVETQGWNSSLEIMLLKRFLQINEMSNLNTMSPRFDIQLPGSEIPELFSYWSEGSTITWPPPHCLLNDELIGFCVCAVFSIPDRSLDAYTYCHFGNRGFSSHSSYCKGGDHLWLLYYSKNTLYRNKDGEYDCGQGLTAEFEIHDYKNWRKKIICSDNWVKRCGIRPVYKQDVEYLKELSARDGAITMASTLQGSRFIKCIHCIKKEINVDYSDDSSAKEGDTGTAAGDIGNSIYI